MNREALQHWLDEFAKDNEDPLPANGLVKGILHFGFDYYDCEELLKVLVGTCDECWKQLRYCKCKETTHVVPKTERKRTDTHLEGRG